MMISKRITYCNIVFFFFKIKSFGDPWAPQRFGAYLWAQGAILETGDRIPRWAPGAWSLLLPLPVSLPLSLSLSLSISLCVTIIEKKRKKKVLLVAWKYWFERNSRFLELPH